MDRGALRASLWGRKSVEHDLANKQQEGFQIIYTCFRHSVNCICFLGGSDSKESAGSVGDPGLIPGSGKSPAEGNGNPPQYSCLGESYGQGSLVGCSPRAHKELERLSN